MNKSFLKRNRTGESGVEVKKVRLGLFVITGLIIANIILSIFQIPTGSKLLEITENEKDLNVDIRKLSNQVVENTSLSKIEKRAKELGFIKPASALYIKGEKPVAQLP